MHEPQHGRPTTYIIIGVPGRPVGFALVVWKVVWTSKLHPREIRLAPGRPISWTQP
jgi:hypothetical protein